MVQPAQDRIQKYTFKYDTPTIKTRLDAAKDMALEKVGVKFSDLTIMEIAAQTVMNQQGINTCDRPKHYNYCREIWRLVDQGVTDPQLTAQVVEVLTPKYVALGCLKADLIALALGVFSITVPP